MKLINYVHDKIISMQRPVSGACYYAFVIILKGIYSVLQKHECLRKGINV